MNNELILDNLEFARNLAKKLKKKMPKSVQYEELESAAYFGLVDACKKYKEGCFKSFAYKRINGEIKDYLRELYWNYNGSMKVKPISDDFLYYKKNDFDEFIEDFPKEVKMIFVNYFVDEMSLQQIADNMECSVGYIHGILKKYLKKIKNVIER